MLKDDDHEYQHQFPQQNRRFSATTSGCAWPGRRVVRDVVTEVVEQEDDLSEKVHSPADFEKWLESWIALHPVLDHAVDDSRESIYAGRGH